MENNGLHSLFVDQLGDMLSAEKQIIEGLPKMIDQASLQELKDALTSHLKETKQQVQRIEQIFSILDLEMIVIECAAMKGLIAEAAEMMRNKSKSPALDAAIIAAAQKIEHYEIASYGTLKSFAKHLGFDGKIIDLLQDSEDEEGAADKKLTKIADGSFFSSGVNKQAAAAPSR